MATPPAASSSGPTWTLWNQPGSISATRHSHYVVPPGLYAAFNGLVLCGRVIDVHPQQQHAFVRVREFRRLFGRDVYLSSRSARQVQDGQHVWVRLVLNHHRMRFEGWDVTPHGLNYEDARAANLEVIGPAVRRLMLGAFDGALSLMLSAFDGATSVPWPPGRHDDGHRNENPYGGGYESDASDAGVEPEMHRSGASWGAASAPFSAPIPEGYGGSMCSEKEEGAGTPAATAEPAHSDNSDAADEAIVLPPWPWVLQPNQGPCNFLSSWQEAGGPSPESGLAMSGDAHALDVVAPVDRAELQPDAEARPEAANAWEKSGDGRGSPS